MHERLRRDRHQVAEEVALMQSCWFCVFFWREAVAAVTPKVGSQVWARV